MNIEIPEFMQDVYNERKQEKLRSEKQRKEIYIANKRRLEERKQIKIEKRNLFKKRVKSAAVASGLVAVGGLAFFGHQQFRGSERIANQFFQYTTDYGISNLSGGYFAYIKDNDTYGKLTAVSLDSVLLDMVNDARYDGMTDTEIYIALCKLYDKDLAEMCVNNEEIALKKISIEEFIAANYNAYALELAEDYGVKISGGIKK